jgi:hypothetical protein
MFLLSRRQTRAAMSAAAGAAVYLAASGLGKDRLKLTGLFVLASVSMAGMATATSSAKAKNVEKRLNQILATGVTIGATSGGVNSITPSKGSFLATVSQQGHRANLNWTPDTHQGGAPASYTQSSFDNCISRVNDLIDATSAVSDRADYILNTVLLNANLVT